MAITIDQTTIGSSSSGNGPFATVAFNTSAIVAAGGFIVIGGGWFSTVTTVSSVAGGSLSWSIDKQGSTGNSRVWIASAQCPAGLASGTTITATFGASVNYPTIGGLSFTGVATSSPVDGTALGPTQVATAAWSTGNYTVAAGSVIVAVDWSEGTVTGNTPTAPSVESHEVITADQAHVIEYRIESGAGAVPVAGTWNTANTNTNAAVAYLADSGTAPVTNEAALRTAHTPVTWRT